MKEVHLGFPTTHGDPVCSVRGDFYDVINLSSKFFSHFCCWLNKASNHLLSTLMNNINF